MLKADFVTELRRVFAGFRCEPDMTPERVAVWWEQYQSESLPRWKRACSFLLGEGGGRPSVSRMEAALEKAEREESEAKIAPNRGGGANPMLAAIEASKAVNAEFLAVQRAVSAAISTGAKPEDVAELLDKIAETDPFTDYSRWIDHLRDAGNDWRRMPNRPLNAANWFS